MVKAHAGDARVCNRVRAAADRALPAHGAGRLVPVAHAELSVIGGLVDPRVGNGILSGRWRTPAGYRRSRFVPSVDPEIAAVELRDDQVIGEHPVSDVQAFK